MGLIKSIFGGIFGLIGSILGSVAKIFGLGKKGEFFMELDEGSAPAPEPQSAPKLQQSAPAKPEPSKAEKVKAPVKVAEKPSESAQASFKEQLPTSPQGATSESVPVAAAKAQMPAVSNFATDYLVNPKVVQSPRRRPGPSLSPFKDMVKDMGRKSASMG